MEGCSSASLRASRSVGDYSPEEHLSLHEAAVAHGGELDVAMTVAGLQLALVKDEDPVGPVVDQFEDLLRPESVGRGGAPLEPF